MDEEFAAIGAVGVAKVREREHDAQVALREALQRVGKARDDRGLRGAALVLGDLVGGLAAGEFAPEGSQRLEQHIVAGSRRRWGAGVASGCHGGRSRACRCETEGLGDEGRRCARGHDEHGVGGAGDGDVKQTPFLLDVVGETVGELVGIDVVHHDVRPLEPLDPVDRRHGDPCVGAPDRQRLAQPGAERSGIVVQRRELAERSEVVVLCSAVHAPSVQVERGDAVGEADAVVSPGNTGASMVAAFFVLGLTKGVERPAIATSLPTVTGEAIILDVGANVDCNAKDLQQFAVMGNEYGKHLFNKPNPRVGLLSIGEEDSKGNEVTKEAFKLLKASSLNFVGNVEGREVYSGLADVVVCDGFIGNVALKISEGVAETISKLLLKEIGGSFWGRLAYPLIAGHNGRPAVALNVEDIDAASTHLQQRGFTLISEKELAEGDSF